MGDNIATCRNCGNTIEWREEGGKNRPYDADGACHFDSCTEKPQRSEGGFKPVGYEYATNCRSESCGAAITMRVIGHKPDGKERWCPYDDDGMTSHFETCPDANKYSGAN